MRKRSSRREPQGRKDVIRRVTFKPYRKGAGPTFNLIMWDTHHYDQRGQTRLGYRLTSNERGHTTTLFEGEDFHGSPMHADDSNETVAALMGFLTLKPGDTDREYFANYSRSQMEFARTHAETLNYQAAQQLGVEDY